MEIINQSLQDFKLGYASSSEGRDFLYPVLNGIDEYATITQWDNASSLYSITYQTSNDDNFVVTTTAPVLEIGRIGANYHSGDIKSIRFIDQTPLQGISAMAGNPATKRGARMPIAAADVAGAAGIEIEFDLIFTPATNQVLFGDNYQTKSLYCNVNTGSSVVFYNNGVQCALTAAALVSGQHYCVRIVLVPGNIPIIYLDNVQQALDVSAAIVDFSALTELYLYDANNVGDSESPSTIGNFRTRNLETGQVWDYANCNDSGNVLENINPATAEGPELFSYPSSLGGGWVDDGNGRFSNPTAFDGFLATVVAETGKLYAISVEAAKGINVSVAVGTSGGLPIVAGVTQYRFGEGNTIKFYSTANDVFVSGISIREVTHGLWYENGVAMTDAAADAARTDLPLINQEWIFTSPGEIFEAYSGQQATLFGIDASNWQ